MKKFLMVLALQRSIVSQQTLSGAIGLSKLVVILTLGSLTKSMVVAMTTATTSACSPASAHLSAVPWPSASGSPRGSAFVPSCRLGTQRE